MTESFWFKEALAAAGPLATERPAGPSTADICIVGGGYLGLWTAIRLKQADPTLDVAIVERNLCGSGASGRNGGFVTSYWVQYLSLLELAGPDGAAWIASRSQEAVSELGEFCSEQAIDCDYRHDGWLWTASSRHQIGAWDGLVSELARHGLKPFEALDPADVSRMSGSDRNLAGIFQWDAATIQPAKLALGLRRVALRLGVKLYEQSPMLRFERGKRPVVHCATGSIEAAKLVIAMNTWATRLRELRRLVAVVSSDVIASAPLAGRLGAGRLRDGLAVCDSRMFLNYWRNTSDGRIVFGRALGHFAFAGRVDDKYEGASPRAGEVEAAWRGFFPMLGDVPVVASWRGPVDRSVDGLPFFGHLGGHPDIVYGLGFSGHGVGGPTMMGGRILSALARETKDEWSRSALIRERVEPFPIEPFRYLGAITVREALRRKERLEDAGRCPGWLTRSLAGLAPSGYVPKEAT
ncbi:MAG TPA: FAD-dependent oxidoreductase [Dongiaceae bacterium]|jgi:putative aminophosphonate oxidoreductase|nr:FAD-dependent oxidoreductase [Dongiaceae bacterium]